MDLKQVLMYLFLLWGTISLNAQNVEYGVELDTNYMMIGDQQQLTFKVKSEQGIQISFPLLRDTIVKGVEIISGPHRDSIKESDGRWIYESKYVITAFDTGMYIIHSMPITVKGDQYNNILRTDPIAFIVNTYQVDAQKGNYDIVMPYAAPWTFVEILPYLLWVLLGISIIAFVWWYWERRKKNKPLFAVKEEEIPPYVKAIRSLDEIKNGKLWQVGREKEYYTRLTDAMRQYFDDEFDIPAMEQTSNETVLALKKCREVEARECERMSTMLMTADFVKFAKFTPLQDENASYLDAAYDFVNVTHQRIEAELAEQQRKEAEKRKCEEEEKAKAVENADESKAKEIEDNHVN
ncbi:MAG: hypothetical protein RSA53_10055 [Odoribacter sp.]